MEKKATKAKKPGRPAKTKKVATEEKIEKVVKPVKTAKKAAGKTVVKKAKTVKTEKPVKAGKAAKAAKPAKIKAPAKTAKPAKAVKAPKAAKPAKVAKAPKAPKSAKPAKAPKAAKKVKETKAAKPRKVSSKRISTRQLILDTAGELFADYGMKGTSIKMIADKSKQNIAAANYHFGSKKNLYVETIKHVVEKLSESSSLSQEKVSAKNFEGELTKFVQSRAKILLSGLYPSWYGSLIVRSLQEAPKNIQEMALEFFRPEVSYLEGMAAAVKPRISAMAAKMWAYTVVSQIIFYVSARKMILLAIGKKGYSPEFINDVVQHIVQTSKLALKN